MINTKEKFYKTPHEVMLKKVVDFYYNNYIGGSENAKLDGDEYHAWTEPELIEKITEDILQETDSLQMEDTLMRMEAKHVRFMGKKRVHEIVEHRVQFRHLKYAWEWEI